MSTPEWQPYRGVRASAGSGKTYQLTGHYLRAFLTGASASELLATTFTPQSRRRNPRPRLDTPRRSLRIG